MSGAGAFADLVPDDEAAAEKLLPVVGALETGGLKDRDGAVSRAGALGRNQIMPATARQYGIDPATLTDGPANDAAALRILSDLHRQFGDKSAAELAGYNGGPGRGRAYVRAGGDPTVLPVETQRYIAKGGALTAPAANPFAATAALQAQPGQGALAIAPPPDINTVPVAPLAVADPGNGGEFGPDGARPAPPPPSPFDDLVPSHMGAGAFADLVPKPGGVVDQIKNIFAQSQKPNAKAPEDPWGASLLKNLENIPAGLEKTAGGLIEGIATSNPLDNPLMAVADPTMFIANKIAPTRMSPAQKAAQLNTPGTPGNFGKRIAADAEAHIRANAPNVAPLSVKGLTNGAVSGVINMIPLMAASRLTGSAAPMQAMIPQLGVQGYADRYAESIAANRTPDQADQDATFSAAANAIPAMLPVHVLMKPGQSFLGKAFRAAFSVAAQNDLTTVLQAGYDKGVIDPKMTWGEVVPRLVQATIVGGITGLALGGGAHGEPKAPEQGTEAPQAAPATPPGPDGGSPPPPPGGPPGGASSAAPAPPAPVPTAPRPQPILDPETWVQTGWKLPDGTAVPLDDPRGSPPPDDKGPPGAPAAILNPDYKPPTIGPDGVPVSAGGQAVATPGGTRIGGRRGPNAGIETLIPGKGLVTPDQATMALQSNIDPRTGAKPVGNAALRQFRTEMQGIIDAPAEGSGSLEEQNSQRGTLLDAKKQENTGKNVQPVPGAPDDRTTVLPPLQDGAAAGAPDAAGQTLGEGGEAAASGNLQPMVPGPNEPIATNGRVRGTKRLLTTGPEDAAMALAVAGGIRNDEGHDLVAGRGLQQFIPGAGKLIRPTGMSIDRAGEFLHERGYFGPPGETPRPTEDEVLQLLERTGRDGQGRRTKVFPPVEQAAQDQARADQLVEEQNADARGEAADYLKGLGEPHGDDDIDAVVGLMGEHGIDAENAVHQYVERLAIQAADQAREESGDESYEVPFHSGEEDQSAGDRGAAGEGERGREAVGTDQGEGGTGAAPAESDRGPTDEETSVGRQTIIPGAERSARQLAAAQESGGRGKLAPTAAQEEPGGMFAEPEKPEPDLFEGGGPKAARTKPFYSTLTRTIEQAKQEKAPAQQWSAMIDNARQKGVKQEEIDWSGVKDWLAEQPGQVSRADLLAHLRENEVNVQEVTKGASGEDVAVLQRQWDKAADAVNSAIAKRLPDDEQNRLRDVRDALRERIEAAQNSGGTKFGKYTLPGGENYRELLLTLPSKDGAAHQAITKRLKELQEREHFLRSEGETDEADRVNAEVRRIAGNRTIGDTQDFRSAHFDEPNVLAHIRFDERTDADGKKAMHIAEIQSDMHQQGRKIGYKAQPDPALKTKVTEAEFAAAEKERGWEAAKAAVVDNARSHEAAMKEWDAALAARAKLPLGDPGRQKAQEVIDTAREKYAQLGDQRQQLHDAVTEARLAHDQANRDLSKARDRAQTDARNAKIGVPRAPFQKNWHELAMKRALRYAAEHGFDRVTWDTGDTQADRYDLSDQVDRLLYKKNADGTYKLSAQVDGRGHLLGERIAEAKLEDHVGKDVAKRIVDGVGPEENIGANNEPRDVWKSLSGLDLKVGGEGMKGFYDKILPDFVNKYTKKFGGRVEDATLGGQRDPFPWKVRDATDDGDGEIISEHENKRDAEKAADDEDGGVEVKFEPGGKAPVHSVAITPAMRESVMQGQPLFAKQRGGGSGDEFPAPKEARPAQGEGRIVTQDKKGSVRLIGSQKDGFYAVFNDATQAKRDELRNSLRSELNRLGLKDIALRVADSLHITSKQEIVGKASGMSWHDFIHIALDTPKKNYNGIIHHETIHALRAFEVIRPKEWDVLSTRADAWIKHYEIKDWYPENKHEANIEEAVAHAFDDWSQGKMKYQGNAVGRAFIRIRSFFEAIDNAFRGMGFHSVESVFRKIESGEVGRRPGPRRIPGEEVDEPPQAARRRDDEGDEEEEDPMAAKRRKPGEPKVKPPGLLTRALGENTENLGRAMTDAADKIFPDSVKEAKDALQMWATPMAQGSHDSRAALKDTANALRKSRVVAGRQMDYLKKTFTPDQLAKMWNAMDEENAAQMEGKPTEGIGLSRLSSKERAVADAFISESLALKKELQDEGMLKGEGVKVWAPRVVVSMGDDGRVRPLGKDDGRVGGLDAMGKNLRTTSSSLKNRKYLTAAETEAAAQKIDENATVVRDFRTLPLKMGELRQALATRRLMNRIKEIGAATGENLVSEGVDPSDTQYKFFTLPHPAFQTMTPKMVDNAETGKREPATDQNGNIVMEKRPVYVRSDFEGPMRAVLDQSSGKLAKALMALKGKYMAVTMFTPMMHNAVIWGKALPAAPLKLINPIWKAADGKWHVSLELYGRGRAAKNDPVTMNEALDNGLDPIGHRYFNQDVTGMLEQDSLKPGQSWTAKMLGGVGDIFSKKLGDATRRNIDKAGDVFHNKFLWNLVGDLQMGLYTHIRDAEIKRGNDPQTAGRMAAHFANRYAGALPIESMSRAARLMSNAMLFSRSFTLTNLGAYKDVVSGLPKDVQSQIMRDKGIAALDRIQGSARRKAAAMLMMDVMLSHIGTFMAQYTLAYYYGRQFVPPAQNEPDKENRFLIGYEKNGRAIYGRLPTGKVGEDLQNWVVEPAALGERKLSPAGHLIYGLAANDQGFGQKIYGPKFDTFPTWLKNAGNVAQFTAESLLPIGPFQSIYDMARGHGDPQTNLMKALLPLVGITIAKGAPGGPAMGQLYSSKDEHEFLVGEQMSGIRDKIGNGDIAGATKEMTALGMQRSYQRAIIRTTLNPGSRLTPRQIKEFMGYATDDEKARMKALMDQQQRDNPPAPSDQHSRAEPDDSILGTLGNNWTRRQAVRAASAAGMPNTAALIGAAPPGGYGAAPPPG